MSFGLRIWPCGSSAPQPHDGLIPTIPWPLAAGMHRVTSLLITAGAPGTSAAMAVQQAAARHEAAALRPSEPARYQQLEEEEGGAVQLGWEPQAASPPAAGSGTTTVAWQAGAEAAVDSLLGLPAVSMAAEAEGASVGGSCDSRNAAAEAVLSASALPRSCAFQLGSAGTLAAPGAAPMSADSQAGSASLAAAEDAPSAGREQAAEVHGAAVPMPPPADLQCGTAAGAGQPGAFEQGAPTQQPEAAAAGHVAAGALSPPPPSGGRKPAKGEIVVGEEPAAEESASANPVGRRSVRRETGGSARLCWI